LPTQKNQSKIRDVSRRGSTHSCNKDAQRKSKLRHSGQRYRTCSKHDERVKTWRLIDESAEFHRQHNKSHMRRPRWPIPGRSSCIGAVAHLLDRIVAIPQLSWPAFFLRDGAMLLDLGPGIIKIALQDQHSSGCRKLHGSCATRRRSLEADGLRIGGRGRR
jgi:hypothetical protein